MFTALPKSPLMHFLPANCAAAARPASRSFFGCIMDQHINVPARMPEAAALLTAERAGTLTHEHLPPRVWKKVPRRIPGVSALTIQEMNATACGKTHNSNENVPRERAKGQVI